MWNSETTLERSLRLPHLVRELRGASRSEIDGLLATTRLDPRSVAPFAHFLPCRYARTLVYRDERVEVLCLAWTKGAAAPIHGHSGQHCWMLPVEGALAVQDWELDGRPESVAGALVRVGEPRLLRPGDVDRRTPDLDLHSVSLPEPLERAISIHVYAGPIDSCLVYDAEPRRWRLQTLQYDFAGPSR